MTVPEMTSLATDMILGAVYINENIEKLSPKKGTLKPTGSSLVAILKIAGNATYMADNVESKQKQFEDEFNQYACGAAYQKI